MNTLTFPFDTSANPFPAVENPAVVAVVKSVSPPGAGYQQSLWLSGTSTGLWDLGPGGLIGTIIPSAETVIASVRFLGGGFYSVGPTITLGGKSPDSFSDTEEITQSNGLATWTMITRRCIWNGVNKTAELNIASPQAMPQDAFVDSVVVQYGSTADSQVASLLDGIKQAKDILTKLLS